MRTSNIGLLLSCWLLIEKIRWFGSQASALAAAYAKPETEG